MTSPAALVPPLPFMRIKRVAEMFRARRNSVSSRSVVGKTLNSTGFRMYMETIITTTDIMMSVTIRMSSMKPGTGVISAITMPSTAIGTPNSFQLVNRSFHGAGAAIAFAWAANLRSLSPACAGNGCRRAVRDTFRGPQVYNPLPSNPVNLLTLRTHTPPHALRRPFISLKI